jgi:hypothetical protein
MSEFRISRAFSHHDGGTKAYQIYEIQIGKAAVPIFQWGAFTTGMNPTRMGGTFDIRPVGDVSSASIAARKQRNTKSRRGYTSWSDDTVTPPNRTEFEETLIELVGRTKALEIMGILAASPLSKVSSKPPAKAPENSNKGKAKAPAITTEESLPEWGTW